MATPKLENRIVIIMAGNIDFPAAIRVPTVSSYIDPGLKMGCIVPVWYGKVKGRYSPKFAPQGGLYFSHESFFRLSHSFVSTKP